MLPFWYSFDLYVLAPCMLFVVEFMKRMALFTAGGGSGAEEIYRYLIPKYDLYLCDLDISIFFSLHRIEL